MMSHNGPRDNYIIVIFGINNKRTYHFPALNEVTFVKRIYFLSIPNLSDQMFLKGSWRIFSIKELQNIREWFRWYSFSPFYPLSHSNLRWYFHQFVSFCFVSTGFNVMNKTAKINLITSLIWNRINLSMSCCCRSSNPIAAWRRNLNFIKKHQWYNIQPTSLWIFQSHRAINQV